MRCTRSRTWKSLICLLAATVSFAAGAETQAQSTTARKSIPPESGAKLYDETADARSQIAGAIAKARRDHTRVLIQWGGNWCPWCIRMAELMKSDRAIAKTLQYEYQVIHVDCGRPNGKNMGLAETYGAGEMKQEGFPYLTILDENGQPVANQQTRTFELDSAKGHEESLKSGHDPKALLRFLEANKAPAVAAQAELDRALAAAKSSGKSVFVHFGAPWCGWCHRLEAWMARPEIAPILAKDFVDVKIDTDRFTGAEAMLKKYAGEKSGGIPWFVFLGPDGKPVIDSNGTDGNIGFPAAATEVAHFEAMLKRAKKNMTDADIAALVESLKAKEPAPAGH